MLELPFPCKIQRDYSSTATVTVLNTGSDKIAQDTLSIFPNAIGEVINITWVNLSYDNIIGLEYWLQRSRATERFLWNGGYYLLEDEYTVEITANKPIVKASLRRVA